ncbi:MAG: hypothetical protein V3U72_02415 [Candidatus Aenigmarchaeota archaeon]
MSEHLYKGSLERIKKHIEGMKLTPKTRSLIERFDKEHKESFRTTTRTNYLCMLRVFLEGTKNLLRQTIMKFYRWENGGEEYPEFIKQIRKSTLKIKRNYDNIDPDDHIDTGSAPEALKIPL